MRADGARRWGAQSTEEALREALRGTRPRRVSCTRHLDDALNLKRGTLALESVSGDPPPVKGVPVEPYQKDFPNKHLNPQRPSPLPTSAEEWHKGEATYRYYQVYRVSYSSSYRQYCVQHCKRRRRGPFDRCGSICGAPSQLEA